MGVSLLEACWNQEGTDEMGLAGGRRAASDTVGEGSGQPVQGVGFLGLNAAAFGAGQFLDMEPSCAPQDVWKDV